MLLDFWGERAPLKPPDSSRGRLEYASELHLSCTCCRPAAVSDSLLSQVDKLPRRQVATVGSWPDPLVIPEEVDELPVSDVPRGFICPITQVCVWGGGVRTALGPIKPCFAGVEG